MLSAAGFAAPEDFEAIMKIVREAQRAIAELGIDQWQDGYPEPELIADDIERRRGTLFTQDGDPAGYAVFLTEEEPIYNTIVGRWLTDGAYVTVHRMMISDRYRGSGLAKKMLAYAEDLARANGIPSVRADTHAGNLRMRRFLERNGFVYCGDVFYPECKGDPLRVAYEKILK